MAKKIYITIRRQDSAEGKAYWETFVLPFKPRLTVTGVLRHIRDFPLNINDQVVPAVVWEDSCAGSVCSCFLLINGKPRQACQTLVNGLDEPVRIEPLSKFPVLRDLVVDRRSLRENQRRMRAWNTLEHLFVGDLRSKISLTENEKLLNLNSCLSCGACLEACPQIHKGSEYAGPAALAQVAFYNQTEVGRLQTEDRFKIVRGKAGIVGCDNAQNCIRVCPQGIPLTEALAQMARN